MSRLPPDEPRRRPPSWRKFLVLSAAALIAMSAGRSVLSREITAGTTVQARANSLWFQDEGKLERWQKLKRSGDAEALAAFEEEELNAREAFRFETALEVKVLDYEPTSHIVTIEMITPGRMQGTEWFVDESAVR